MSDLKLQLETVLNTSELQRQLKRLKSSMPNINVANQSVPTLSNNSVAKDTKKMSKTNNDILGMLATGVMGALEELSAGTLLIIAGISIMGARIVGGMMSVFNTAFSWFDTLGKLIGMLVLPFINVLFSPLLLLITILTPFVRMINVFMKPFLLLSMRFIKDIGAPLNKLISKFLRGKINVIELLTGIGKVVFDALANMFEAIKPALISILQGIGSVIMQFLNIDVNGITNKLEQAFGNSIGGAIGLFVRAIHFITSALVGIAVDLIGNNNIGALFGKTAEETNKIVSNLKTTNSGFNTGTNLGELIKSLIDVIGTIIASITDFFMPTEEGTNSPFDNMINTITKFVSKIDDFISPVKEGATSQFQTLINILIKVFTALKVYILDSHVISRFSSAMINLIDTINKWANLDFTGLVNKYIRKKFSGSRTGRGGSTFGVRDAIITPSGQVIQTDPKDYLIATKNPQGLTNNTGNITVNINVSGNSDTDLVRKINDVIRRELRGRVSYGRG